MKYTKQQLDAMTFEERFATLSKREQKYFRIMNAKAGVLYATSKPGLAKSAIFRNIAYVLGYNYFDIRLAMVDETDVGLFPYIQIVVKDAEGNIIHSEKNVKGSFSVLDYAVPKWAMLANESPSIIHFEELNRASLPVRNSALQILLEREIGTMFKFNENVLMCATGNLGEEDGTDVEEFDSALNNRLIHVKHDLLYNEWIENFAQYKVHPMIVGFINAKPDCYYRVDGGNGEKVNRAYATPRSWTHLSEFLMCTLGDREGQMNGKYNIQEIIEWVNELGHSYVGTTSHIFIKYLNDIAMISAEKVLNDFKTVKPILEKSNRDRHFDIVNQLNEMDLTKLNNKQVTNLVKFIETLQEDSMKAFLMQMTTKYKVSDEPIKTIILSFEDALFKMSDRIG